ncbi:MAG: choice-of-anchor L domain-containing protein [Bacteroidia bacterium]
MRLNLPGISRAVAVLVGVFCCLSVNGQLTTTTTLTPQQLVQNVLLGPGITASNITYTGYANAIGKFVSVNTGLGIDSGIVMTSGSVIANDPLGFGNLGPMGPNISGSDGVGNNAAGDNDLTTISGNQTFDAAVLAFDFISQSDSVKFRYVFGSEEYSDFVNTSFNDAFAFFLSGVTVTLTPTNIALIPSTTIPVTINNVNNGQTAAGPAPGPCMNCAYYVDNPANAVTPYSQIQYDGFTTVLTASYPVVCGQTYHIKLAIADCFDEAYDSGVFLEAGSFSSGQVDVSTEISYGSLNDSTLFEGCGQACIILTRSSNLANPDTAQIIISGTAVNGVDYTPLIPATIVFPAGVDSITICIQATQDGIPEGLETIVFTSITQGICSQSIDSTTIYLSDFLPIDVDAGHDTTLCFATPITITTNVTGGVQPYTYLWSTGAQTATITVSPSTTTSYTVTVTDPCGSTAAFDTVTVFLPGAGPLSTTTTPDLTICEGDPAMLAVLAINGSLPYSYSWSTIAGPAVLPTPTSSSNSFTPSSGGTFVVLTTDGCNNTQLDTISIDIRDCAVIPPNVFTPNGDGTNDNLVFTGLENFPGTSLQVYGRWGNKIYENADYHNDWNGSGVSDGTYYYILIHADGTTRTGFITIIK